MNKKLILGILLVTLLLFGCVAGTKTDLGSGQKTNYSGLSFEDSSLLVDGVTVNKVQAYSGQKVSVSFTGIEGFTETDGKVFVDVSLTVLQDGNETLSMPSLLSKYSDGVTTDQASELSASWTVGENAQVGKVYTMKVRIWDMKGKGEITTELPVTILSSPTQ